MVLFLLWLIPCLLETQKLDLDFGFGDTGIEPGFWRRFLVSGMNGKKVQWAFSLVNFFSRFLDLVINTHKRVPPSTSSQIVNSTSIDP